MMKISDYELDVSKTLTLFSLHALLFLFGSVAYAQNPNALKLWYEKPANPKVWEQALPIGNGRLGAMVYGVPQREELQLNEETIWGGRPYNNDNEKAKGSLSEIQKLIFDGKVDEADKVANERLFTKTHGMPYQTAGSVIFNFPHHEEFQNYYRELDISNAVASTSYLVDGVTYTRQVFSSFSDDVIVMRFTASKKAALNFDIEYGSPAKHRTFKSGNTLVLEGFGDEHEGVPGEVIYQTHTAVNSTDGKIAISDEKLSVSNATTVYVYISIGTNFIDYKTLGADYVERASSKLSAAMKRKYTKALKDHSAIYHKQFNRFKLDLGKHATASQRPTEERIFNFKNTQDPSLVTLLTQFGRYLLICSSQPGGQPANLQGIWNNSQRPAWDSKYTININTEMNYWPAEVTNISETHQPLFQMIKELSESGAGTARNLYQADGWVAHHNTDIWRVTSPIDFAAAGMWPTGGTWLSQHLWEHYLYTGDKEFLREVFPIMKGAADFLLSMLVEHPNHKEWLVLSPSVSPEHGDLAAGVTMDNQLVFDMLTRTALADEILDDNEMYRQELKSVIERIPPMQIGQHTQLQEWLEDKDDPKSDHRHVSHLYGLYPSNQISPYRTPELFEAARNSLKYRGDFATGWSIGWKINLWARLLDGNHAYKIINNMLTLAGQQNGEGRTYPNLFTAHPPFQIDGNFGLTAGVAEMLIQSHDGAVHLLPAIPDQWRSGTVKGIKARGGFEVDMDWTEGEISKLSVQSTIGGNLRLRSNVPLVGKGLLQADGENENNLLNPAESKIALVNKNANIKGVQLKTVYEYDLFTKAGSTYILKRK